MALNSFGMIDPAIFEHLQSKIDEDSKVREELRNILQDLEKQGIQYPHIPRDDKIIVSPKS